MDGNGRQIVLVADDCPASRRLCERLLEREGFVIAQAANGAEAIEAARSLLPHVIIMDIMMPVMDGLEATRSLRADPLTARIPIIVASAKAEEEDLAAGLAAGADEYVVKPVRAREFRLRVRSMVRLREAQLDLERANAALRQQTRLLGRMNQFSEGALARDSFEAICRHIVETAAELVDSDRVSLLVPEPSGESLRFAYAVGMDEDRWRELRVPLDSPIAGHVFTTEQEVVVNTDDPHPNTIGQYDSDGFASFPLVCTPLRWGEGSIGVLNVTGRHDGCDYPLDDIEALRQFCQTAALALNNAQTRQKLDETRDSIIFSLARLSEYRHQETGKHLERVRDLSVLVARRLASNPRIGGQIDESFIVNIGRASPLHDIGKVAIPDRILLKPGRLTEEEFGVMREHARIGAETLRSVIASGHEVGFLQMAMEIAQSHHERWDGRGYPDGLAGDQIPLSARIVCLADTYDAIRMERVYKPARSHEDATSEVLKASGGQFDPRTVQAYSALEEQFREIYDHYAEGSWAEADSALAPAMSLATP